MLTRMTPFIALRPRVQVLLIETGQRDTQPLLLLLRRFAILLHLLVNSICFFHRWSRPAGSARGIPTRMLTV